MEISIHELHDELTLGKTACNIFVPDKSSGYDPDKGYNVNYVDDYGLTTSGKRNIFFGGGQVIFVDIDHTDYTITDFLNVLANHDFSPTIYHTTYSHLKKELRHRFRLVYVFDKLMEGFKQYEGMAKAVNRYVSEITGATLDPVGTRPAQYFNGTCRTNETISANFQSGCDVDKVYSYNKCVAFFDALYDYNIAYWADPEKQEQFREEAYKEIIKTAETNEKDKNRLKLNGYMLAEMRMLTVEQYWKLNRGRYKLYYRTPIDFPDGCDYTQAPDGYFSFYWHYKPLESGRRKKIQLSMMIRRYVYPDITVNELIYNAYVEAYIYNFYANDDGVITVDCIKNKALYVAKLSMEYIEMCVHESVQNLQRKFANTKIVFRPGIALEDRTKYRMQVTRERIAELYDPTISIKENHDTIFSGEVMKASLPLLYTYCDERGIDRNPKDTLLLETIRKNYDNKISDAKNARALGITPSKLSRIFKKHPELRNGELVTVEPTPKQQEDTACEPHESLMAKFDNQTPEPQQNTPSLETVLSGQVACTEIASPTTHQLRPSNIHFSTGVRKQLSLGPDPMLSKITLIPTPEPTNKIKIIRKEHPPTANRLF